MVASAHPSEAPTSQPGRARFASMLRTELTRTFGWRHAVGMACMMLMGVALAVWLPTFPDSVYRFFQRVFQLNSWSEIAVANDMAGLFFFAYWIAVFDVLTIYIQPREERRLDLFLTKPLTRAEYLLAKLLPIVLTLVAIYLAGAFAHWLALQAAGLAYPLGTLAGANFILLAWTVCLVSFVNLAVLGARDTYTALLLACVPMLASILPSTIYMYRPDVFNAAPLLRALVVFPLNLIWYPDFSAGWGFAIGGLLLGLSAFFVAAAAWTFEQRDLS